MNEGRPYLQMWRGVWVSFCKIAKVSFLYVRYRSNVLYCRMAGVVVLSLTVVQGGTKGEARS